MRKRKFAGMLIAAALSLTCLFPGFAAFAEEGGEVRVGGGYAVTGQIKSVGYSAKLYDAESGLPTSDANFIMSSSDGYIYIGGYSGIVKYDGSSFERLDSSEGLTSGRAMLEDSKGRIWVGTNDNGIVLIDGEKRTQYTYSDGLLSSSVRSIAEGRDGIIYFGLATGAAYIGADMKLCSVDDERLGSASVMRLVSDSEGLVYGNTRNGEIFCLDCGRLVSFYESEEIGASKITTIYADPELAGTIWFGTDSDKLYRGRFGEPLDKLTEISVAPVDNTGWITRACGRIWVNSGSVAGYLDENERFHELTSMPLNNAIEMMTPDYQGNLWFASTRQGVMKVAASNFRDFNFIAGLEKEVVNATCLFDGFVYIGTDKGLRIVDENFSRVENELTDYIGDARIRCITADSGGSLWISTYTDDMGLVRLSPEGVISSFTQENGLVNDFIRCTKEAADGSLLVGSNGGLSIIKGSEVIRNVGAADGVKNTVVLTVEETADGKIYLGTDGDGIYVIDGGEIKNLGRGDGLTSDVILRLKRDDKRDVMWIVTSNSIEYMKDGVITNVKEFPYSNNFDIAFGTGDDLWVLSSYGIYRVNAPDMLDGGSVSFELCNTANGLPSIPTANGFSALGENGDLYIAGRSGVSLVNIYHYFEQTNDIKVGIRSLVCEDKEVLPDENGIYTIPAVSGRIQIKAAILDYTLSDPTVHIFLDGIDDPGITASQSELTALGFTGLPYGDYTFRIQVLDGNDGRVFEDRAFRVKKLPQFVELLIVKVLSVAFLVVLAGIIVWRVMTWTIIKKQYEQIRVAKEEAERANSAKSRFLANMSHEIRTPINTIMGMDEMILREDAEKVPEGYYRSVTNYALDIKSASESLLGLINDLLDISKIESGKMHLVEQEYDVAEMLRFMAAMIRIRSEQKGLTFGIEADETVPRRLYGDVGKIKQIVLNLLTNAVKYTEKGGFTLKLAVTERLEDSVRLRVSVKDTGIGVKQEDMEKLFTAYERLDEEKNSGIQGTGLGLDISRRFAELMKGDLRCESVYGEGSEFILTFTQRIVDAEGIGKFDEKGSDRPRGAYIPLFTAPRARVLVVDDNPMNLTVIKGLLKATKVNVTTASSGEECLDILSKGERFEVVFLDHMMPGMDGLETVARIRETLPGLPVYALTANITAGGDEFYRSKGFDGYLTKPIDSPALEKTILSRLPEGMAEKAEASDISAEPEELPEDKAWLGEVEGIDVTEGIKNSGGTEAFLFSLNMFLDTLDDSSAVIEEAFAGGDIRLYTVKVHALKSSARIIGAAELSEMAQALENAGNKEDTAFIAANTPALLVLYRSYRKKLARLKPEETQNGGEPIPEEELADAYSALRDVIGQMDYDSVEMILDSLKEYRLPPDDAHTVSKLEKMLKTFDWDGMEEIIKDRAE